MNYVEIAGKFDRMIWGQAIKVWGMLPRHTRTWVSPEDLVMDGKEHLIFEVIPGWDESRGQMSTVVHESLHNYLIDHYQRFFWRERRKEKLVSSLDQRVEELRKAWGIKDGLEQLGEIRDFREEMLRQCYTVVAISTIYREATRGLKLEMVRWFLEAERLRLESKRFLAAKQEFREKANKLGLGPEDVRYVFRTPICMEKLTKNLRSIQ